MQTMADMQVSVRDRGVFWGLLGLLLWAPLPLGSNRTVAVGVLVLWAVLLVWATAWAWRYEQQAAWARLARMKWPLMVLGLFVAYVWLQTWELPSQWIQVLSPETWAVEHGIVPPRISMDVHQTLLQAALSVAYLCSFLVAVLTVRDRHRLEQLAMWVVAVGVLQAVLAVVLFSMHASYHVFFFEVHHDRAIGTYGYHNHFAGYMELCLSVGIGLMLARLGNTVRQSKQWKHRVAQMLKFMLSTKMVLRVLRVLLVVLVIALVLTRSRMGNSAFFGSLLVVGTLTLALTRRSAPAMVALIVSLIVVDVVVIGTWVGLEKVVERLEGTSLTAAGGGKEESIEVRTDAARHALDLLDVFPLVGTGGGSFYNTYIRYRTPREGYFDHAHNDYAELASEYGVVGMGLLGAFVVLTFVSSARTMHRRRSSLPRGVSFGVMMAIVALAIHSTVDFNLQLPSNALLLIVVMSMGWIARELPSGRDHVERGAP